MGDEFAVRCLFEWPGYTDKPDHRIYEERIVLLRASSPNEALERAVAEAGRYAEENGFTWIRFGQAYAVEPSNEPVREVFSLLRESPLDHDAYADTFEQGCDYERFPGDEQRLKQPPSTGG